MKEAKHARIYGEVPNRYDRAIFQSIDNRPDSILAISLLSVRLRVNFSNVFSGVVIDFFPLGEIDCRNRLVSNIKILRSDLEEEEEIWLWSWTGPICGKLVEERSSRKVSRLFNTMEDSFIALLHKILNFMIINCDAKLYRLLLNRI